MLFGPGINTGMFTDGNCLQKNYWYYNAAVPDCISLRTAQVQSGILFSRKRYFA
jgi:hypothetical protein